MNRRWSWLAVLLLAAAACTANDGTTERIEMEEPKEEAGPRPVETKNSVATFGGGCFWCVEAVFERLDGVASVESGYAGGEVENPTYDAVCSGGTGHAEVCRIEFDSGRISYLDLLKVFFQTHDPTTLNRQGADVGTQYRSVVFTHDDGQKEIVESLKRELDASGAFDDPIVTEISPLPRYWPAEIYHQDYYSQNPTEGYCAYVIGPKLSKFEKAFKAQLKGR